MATADEMKKMADDYKKDVQPQAARAMAVGPRALPKHPKMWEQVSPVQHFQYADSGLKKGQDALEKKIGDLADAAGTPLHGARTQLLAVRDELNEHVKKGSNAILNGSFNAENWCAGFDRAREVVKKAQGAAPVGAAAPSAEYKAGTELLAEIDKQEKQAQKQFEEAKEFFKNHQEQLVSTAHYLAQQAKGKKFNLVHTVNPVNYDDVELKPDLDADLVISDSGNFKLLNGLETGFYHDPTPPQLGIVDTMKTKLGLADSPCQVYYDKEKNTIVGAPPSREAFDMQLTLAQQAGFDPVIIDFPKGDMSNLEAQLASLTLMIELAKARNIPYEIGPELKKRLQEAKTSDPTAMTGSPELEDWKPIGKLFPTIDYYLTTGAKAESKQLRHAVSDPEAAQLRKASVDGAIAALDTPENKASAVQNLPAPPPLHGAPARSPAEERIAGFVQDMKKMTTTPPISLDERKTMDSVSDKLREYLKQVDDLAAAKLVYEKQHAEIKAAMADFADDPTRHPELVAEARRLEQMKDFMERGQKDLGERLKACREALHPIVSTPFPAGVPATPEVEEAKALDAKVQAQEARVASGKALLASSPVEEVNADAVKNAREKEEKAFAARKRI